MPVLYHHSSIIPSLVWVTRDACAISPFLYYSQPGVGDSWCMCYITIPLLFPAWCGWLVMHVLYHHSSIIPSLVWVTRDACAVLPFLYYSQPGVGDSWCLCCNTIPLLFPAWCGWLVMHVLYHHSSIIPSLVWVTRDACAVSPFLYYSQPGVGDSWCLCCITIPLLFSAWCGWLVMHVLYHHSSIIPSLVWVTRDACAVSPFLYYSQPGVGDSWCMCYITIPLLFPAWCGWLVMHVLYHHSSIIPSLVWVTRDACAVSPFLYYSQPGVGDSWCLCYITIPLLFPAWCGWLVMPQNHRSSGVPRVDNTLFQSRYMYVYTCIMGVCVFWKLIA